MCGSYVTLEDESWEDFRALLNLEFRDEFLAGTWRPTQTTSVVVRDGDRNVLTNMRWGLIPGSSPNPDRWLKKPLFNVRSESADQKFRADLRERRCIVPAKQFIEWTPEPGKPRKKTHFFESPTSEVLPLAGIWSSWSGDDKHPGPIHSFSVLTTDPNDVVRPIHNRMPVVLAPDDMQRWLGDDAKEWKPLMTTPPNAWVCDATPPPRQTSLFD